MKINEKSLEAMRTPYLCEVSGEFHICYLHDDNKLFFPEWLDSYPLPKTNKLIKPGDKVRMNNSEDTSGWQVKTYKSIDCSVLEDIIIETEDRDWYDEIDVCTPIESKKLKLEQKAKDLQKSLDDINKEIKGL